MSQQSLDEMPTTPAGGADESSGMGRIESVMGQLQYLMESEYVKLREAKADFAKEKEYYDMLKQKINSTMPREDERLKLNVGGVRHEIRESIAVKNQFFKTLLSGTFSQRDADGHFYIDRDPFFVRHVLNYLRDGAVWDLSKMSQMELEQLRRECEFYMVPELHSKISDMLSSEGAGGVVTASFNTNRTYPYAFNGIFFEINIKKECKLHSVTFIAGERRRIPCDVLLREGGIDGGGQTQKIGVVSEQADKGEAITLHFSSVPLAVGTYTLGFYSMVPSAVTCCPRDESKRPYDANFSLGRTYHITNQKGDWAKKAGEDEFDFCGELALSF